MFAKGSEIMKLRSSNIINLFESIMTHLLCILHHRMQNKSSQTKPIKHKRTTRLLPTCGEEIITYKKLRANYFFEHF